MDTKWGNPQERETRMWTALCWGLSPGRLPLSLSVPLCRVGLTLICMVAMEIK